MARLRREARRIVSVVACGVVALAVTLPSCSRPKDEPATAPSRDLDTGSQDPKAKAGTNGRPAETPYKAPLGKNDEGGTTDTRTSDTATPRNVGRPAGTPNGHVAPPPAEGSDAADSSDTGPDSAAPGAGTPEQAPQPTPSGTEPTTPARQGVPQTAEPPREAKSTPTAQPVELPESRRETECKALQADLQRELPEWIDRLKSEGRLDNHSFWDVFSEWLRRQDKYSPETRKQVGEAVRAGLGLDSDK